MYLLLPLVHILATYSLTHIFIEPVDKYLKAALQDGFIPHKDDLFLFHGPGGVGKSSLIAMLLGKQRKLIRDSTAVAEEPLHVCPTRDVLNQTFTADWELVGNDRMSRMIAHTSHHLISNKRAGEQEEEKNEHEEIVADGQTTEEENQQPMTTAATEAFLAVNKPRKKNAFSKLGSLFRSGLSKITKKSPKEISSLVTTLEDDPDNIMEHFEKFQEDLKELMLESKKVNDFIQSHSIRILDSGGQPQFHELASILLPGITGITAVVKLSELLSAHGEVAWYKDGVQVNVPYASYLTNEQVIRHTLQAIQSQASSSDIEEMPNLAFVGTFQDQQDTCTEETPDEKDERLHSMITEILPEEMQQCVITNGQFLRNTMFRVNARTPEEGDFETVRRLKEALVSKSRAKPRDLPLKWCGLQVALCVMMEKMGRQVLSREECDFLGHKLGFDPPSLKAALNYLRELHIIWFHDALPHVVFGSSQVIMNKVTEIVVYCLELKKEGRALSGEERKFVQQGIISLAMLATFSKHYRSGLFCPEDLLKILKSVLVVTEVGCGEYLVPCVLEVSSIYPSPSLAEGSVRSSFALHFSKKSPMIGIYCCAVSYLMSEAGWKPLTEGGEVVQVARNGITFEAPRGLPGKLCFLDPLSSYLEVVVELPAIVAEVRSAELYREIRDTFFTAIQRAMETLHYKVRTPELSFLCPEQSGRCSKRPHLATVDHSQTLLKCSIKPGTVYSSLAHDQKMWLNAQSSPEAGEYIILSTLEKCSNTYIYRVKFELLIITITPSFHRICGSGYSTV